MVGIIALIAQNKLVIIFVAFATLTYFRIYNGPPFLILAGEASVFGFAFNILGKALLLPLDLFVLKPVLHILRFITNLR